MTKNKLIVLGIGLILIIILSALLIVLQPDSEQSTQQTNVESEANNAEENTSANENTPESDNDFNMPDEDGVAGEEGTGNNVQNGQDDEQLREYAASALDEVNLHEDPDNISEDLLYAHAELNLLYTQMAEQDSKDIDSSQNSAEWPARERYMWYEFASEEFGFSYDKDEFLTTAEEEVYAEEASNRLAVLLEVLENEDDDYYTGQLVYQNLQPYIWHEIKEDAASHYDPDAENEDEREEIAERMFAQDVIEYIGDEYPEYLEGENN